MKTLFIILVSALPVLEQKFAIGYALANGYSNVSAFLLTLVGALIPSPLILLFLPKVFLLMRKKNIMVKFVDWYENKALKRGKNIIKYELLGLLLFVAIPLPLTGIWTGSAVAAFIGLDFKKSFVTVVLGAIICGIILLLVYNGIFSLPWINVK